jgi:4-alpha-glucanotransferase
VQIEPGLEDPKRSGKNAGVIDMTSAARRASGVLLHPTSLPGANGIGDIGPAARTWIDFLQESATRLWQILPLGPTGYGDSPYQCFSSFAGNPYLVSPEDLAEAGLLTAADLADYPRLPADHVDYGKVIPAKVALLDRAFNRLVDADDDVIDAFVDFRQAHAHWLEDFSLFMALKDEYGGRPWTEWDRPLRLRHHAALVDARTRLADHIDRHAFRQYLFAEQWARLRAHAVDAGVTLIGDLPVYVAADSADVWANQHLFRLDDEGRPSVVAGVPPDYFSATGQLWGNPLYDWNAHAAERYGWWISRIEATLAQVDIVRIDHFRAFADYWEIPATAPTAETGRWLDGPGDDFFASVRESLGHLPIIAEDLGELSEPVHELRDRQGLPGMKILQFAFDDDVSHPFLPHNYPELCVAYTGTHDNDTVIGWYASAPEHEATWAREYLSWDGADPAGRFVEEVWASAAMFALAPLQDLLRLGTEARMNTPGVAGGNWGWRIDPEADLVMVAEELRQLNELYRR